MTQVNQVDNLDNSDVVDFTVFGVELPRLSAYAQDVYSCLLNNLMYMSHFAYVCKMRCPLNLVLESWEYIWFYWTFCIVILDYGLKLHKLSNHTLVILQKWLEIH